MGKKSAEDYLDKLLNSVNDEKRKKEKFQETAKMLEDAMLFWEKDTEDLGYEEASYKAMDEKKEEKSGQEKFLDSLLNGAKDTEFGMNKRKVNPNPMYSRRVSKSEADFLREFEEELAKSDDDFAELFGQFDDVTEPEDGLSVENIQIQPEDKLSDEDIRLESPEQKLEQVQEQEKDSFTLGGVDLASIVEEASGNIGEMKKTEEDSMDIYVDNLFQDPKEIPMDTIALEEIPEDVFGDLFGGEENESQMDTMPPELDSEGADTESIDLGNLAEEDLMSLLAGTDDLADIGDMLSKNVDGAEGPVDGLDAFAAFAESEMSNPDISVEPVEEELGLDKKGKKSKGKGGLLGKLSGIISGLLSDDDEDEVELKKSSAPSPEALSGENAEILAELESLEEKPSKKKKDKKKKEKKPKKEKKEKKPKAKKEPKPKKEKKPKEVDNTPPLPKGPVFMIWLVVGSLFALVLLGVNTVGYSSAISNAKNLKNQAHYAEAFAELSGLEIKEKDLELYDQLAILATADSELNAYYAFAEQEMVVEAFDSLICAAGRCDLNEENADVYGCLGQLEILKKTAANELESKYNTTYEEALEMYNYSKHDRDAYSTALYEKLLSLGYELD